MNDLDKQLKTLYLNDTVTSNELYHKIEMEYRQIAVQNEFNAVMQLTKEQNFPKLIAKNYLQMLKYKKRAHSTNFTIVMKQSLFKAKKRTKRLLIKTFLRQTYDPKSNQENVILLENESSRQAINALKSCQNELDSSDEHFILKNSILHQIILEYQSKIDRINNYQLRQQEEYQIVYQEYFLKTLDEERTVIQCLFEQGKISSELAHQLRQSLNYNESTFLQGTFDD
ncbi:hypothetical protein P7H62_00685 [Vagococcus carniphilus]|uniref:hypothetical protein n=1 Tax=Vagococcus carniphilus TaxID=218144 RepID=UPI00288EE804|nr:hypothetical protein [Vagococcus carniphilus]MDT2829427.1 hypothetical protein [Vagococcus carniphilus]MDT2838886.1 hypothetical protein [Vagococcus carniphilus]MDT2852944.1 hypothetical protein [Vagococcus carniphilus]